MRHFVRAAGLLSALLFIAIPSHAQSDGIALGASRSGASDVSLAWSGGVAPFDVYRSSAPATLFAPGSQLTETSGSSWLDTPPANTLTCYGIKNAPDSTRIQIARSQPDGPSNVPLLGSIVTYIRPAIGTEPVGFFVQDSQPGPALFVAVDPTLLSPSPSVGDRVAFTVTSMGTFNQLRAAFSVSNLSRLSAGNPIGGLAQDVSNYPDLVSSLGSYDSELISITGVVTEAFHAQGTGFVGAQITTNGMPAPDANFIFRATPSVVDARDLELGCVLRLTNTPLWRFNAAAQPMAWNSSEVVPLSCPRPRVIKAIALSSTTVAIDFDRRIDPASVISSGSQFVFSAGLSASAASVNARRVTVTTSSQVSGQAYSVTVAGTVTDLLGSSVDPSANSASFAGYAAPALLVINEVNPNISLSKDLVELLVVVAGSTAGFTLEQGVATPLILATLPDMPVASGDIIVVHLVPGTGEGPASETTSKFQYGSGLYANNYDTAWDVNGGATGITSNDRVILLRLPTATIADAVPFVLPAGSDIAAFPADLQSIQAAARWLPSNCGGIACTNTSTPTAKDVSVSWAGVGTSKTGFSVQRLPSGDTNLKADWKAAAAQTFGFPNSP